MVFINIKKARRSTARHPRTRKGKSKKRKRKQKKKKTMRKYRSRSSRINNTCRNKCQKGGMIGQSGPSDTVDADRIAYIKANYEIVEDPLLIKKGGAGTVFKIRTYSGSHIIKCIRFDKKGLTYLPWSECIILDFLIFSQCFPK